MFTYEQIQSLNELELSVYNYVIQHTDQVREMKIRELADNAHVSTSTILRFCTKMGCDGYSEFKLRLKMLEEKKAEIDIPDDTAIMLDFFKKINTDSFKKSIQDAADLIGENPNVYFSGIGSSGVLGQYGARFFSNIGIYSSYIIDPFYPVPDANAEDSVLIVLSVSGETSITLHQVNLFKQKKFKIISITNSDNSTLGKVSDCVISYYLPIETMGDYYKEEKNNQFFQLYNTTTQVPVIHIIETLGRKVQQQKSQKNNPKSRSGRND